MAKIMINEFEELIKAYRPLIHNGTTPVVSLPLGGQSALLSVEIAAMAPKMIFNETPDDNMVIRENVNNSLEKSLRDNSSVWDELSKH